MMNKHLCNTLLCIFSFFSVQINTHAQDQPQATWSFTDQDYNLTWNLNTDAARLISAVNQSVVWQGGLLPAFWLQLPDQQKAYVKATVDFSQSKISEEALELHLQLAAYGTGMLSVKAEEWGVQFTRLSVQWNDPIPAIIEMYFGTTVADTENAGVQPTWNRPFWPDWQSAGYCIPGAKAGTVQSYFRNWDFGQANIVLGSFGPSLGIPYGAAYPRPVLFAGMGSDQGWIAFGVGSVPDGALTFNIQSTRGCFQYLYREDLWGALAENERIWEEPLRITTGKDAWHAFRKYYSSFPADRNHSPSHHTAVWNTWGDWRHGDYSIHPIADFAQKIGAEMLVTDDPWESSQGSGTVSVERFPNFYEDIEYIREKDLQTGIWETIGWISDLEAAGLDESDLILGKNGKPCKANWNFSPSGTSFYCMDISSERVQSFLKERTLKVMHDLKPNLIKLDFGYGLPNPNMGVPRNPAYRGERYAYHLMKIIVEAAKSVNPEVTVMNYGISPLVLPLTDMVSLDDQGDLWYAVKQGHQEWSLWASLLSNQQVAINASSGYDWSKDEEILLNTVILGSPGSVLPSSMDGGSEVPSHYINRRYAVNQWYRKTIQWEPLWLNSHIGNLSAPPQLNCWGRLEKNDGKEMLTALVLRDEQKESLTDERISNIDWTGKWALIAQDLADIFSSKQLAIIPFDAGKMAIPLAKKPRRISSLSLTNETDFSDWQWIDGKLVISVNQAKLDDSCGFLVH